MTYTLEDAIKGMVRYQESKIHPLHAKAFNDLFQIWVDTISTAPTEMRRLELEIGRKKRMRRNEPEAARKWRIDAAIEALEWVGGRIICKDFELWAKAG